jgi:cell division septum initiation protein DivIVA
MVPPPQALPIVFRGYDCDQTDAALARIEAAYREAIAEREELAARLAAAERRAEAAEAEAARLRADVDTVAQAHLAVTRRRTDARTEIERERHRALREIAAIRAEAERDAAGIREAAQAEGRRLLGELEQQLRRRQAAAEAALDDARDQLHGLVETLVARASQAPAGTLARTDPAPSHGDEIPFSGDAHAVPRTDDGAGSWCAKTPISMHPSPTSTDSGSSA